MSAPSFDVAGREVVVCLPAYDSRIPCDWMVAFIGSMQKCTEHGVRLRLEARCGSALIHTVRNEMVHSALAKGATDVLFIDSDVIWTPDDLMRLIAWGCEFPVVAGLYCTKTEELNFHADPFPDADAKVQQNAYGLVKARGVPTGFLLMRSEVFSNPALRAQCVYTKRTKGDLAGQRVLGFFDFMHDADTETGYGEDIAFCRRLSNAGVDIWMDPVIHLKHIGSKAYEADYSTYLIERSKKQQDVLKSIHTSEAA